MCILTRADVLMAFTALQSRGQFSPWVTFGSVCSCDGLVALEMLCIETLLFAPWAASTAHPVAGVERDLWDLCSAFNSKLLRDHGGCWLHTERACVALQQSWSCSAQRSLLHMCRIPGYKMNFSDPHEAHLPAWDFVVCWTGFPNFIFLWAPTVKSCSFRLYDH